VAHLIWFAVVGMMAVLNAVLIYITGIILAKFGSAERG